MRAAFILPTSRLIRRAYSLSLQLRRARTFPRVWMNVRVDVHGRMSIEGTEGEEKLKEAFILRYSVVLDTPAITETTLVQI